MSVIARVVSWHSAPVSQKIKSLTLLLVDLHLDVVIDTHDDQVAEDVETAHGVQDIGILKGHLFGHLHHTKDDHQVGAGASSFESVRVSLGGMDGTPLEVKVCRIASRGQMRRVGWQLDSARSTGLNVHLRTETSHDGQIMR